MTRCSISYNLLLSTSSVKFASVCCSSLSSQIPCDVPSTIGSMCQYQSPSALWCFSCKCTESNLFLEKSQCCFFHKLMMLWLYAPASCGLVSLTHIPQRMRIVLANIRHLTPSHSPQTHFITNKKSTKSPKDFRFVENNGPSLSPFFMAFP